MSKKRESKGIQLLKRDDSIRQDGPSAYRVRSQSDSDTWYKVRWQEGQWTCNCPDYSDRRKKCKHIYAVCYHLALQDVSNAVEDFSDGEGCPKCGSTDHVIKKGFRYNRSGPVQRYECKRCDFKFTERTGFEGMKNRGRVIASALDLYFRGLSLRQVAEHLETSHGVEISHTTVHNWLKKYVDLVSQNVREIVKDTSERWHADETLVRVKGRNMVLWSLLDSETRFLLAMHISQGRGEEDAETLMRKGVEASKHKPDEVVTDGLSSYNQAIKEECLGSGPLVHLQGPLTEALNNKMERFFRTLKDRTKTVGGFVSEEGAEMFSEGFATHYNFVKKHRSLDGKTPAQEIGLGSKWSWLDLITAAAGSKKSSAKED